MAELGYNSSQMAKLLFQANTADFERDFLDSDRLRLVVG
jgi:hypothetical protein